MPVSKQVYLLDAGNTQIKIALAQEGLIQWVKRFELDDFPLHSLDSNIPLAFSSVVQEAFTSTLRSYFKSCFEVTHQQRLPFQMAYRSPDTLGKDRLCNAAALSQLAPGKPKLAIDLGTCIKFDFVTAQQAYLGGSISPGLKMRAQALATFTAKLPELELNMSPALIGSDSKSSMEIGTYMGWQKEIEGMLAAYFKDYPDLQVFITGGDAKHFDLGQKNGIFVHENLTLEGIFALYQANA